MGDITKKEIVTILKKNNLMVKGYKVDAYIRKIYQTSTIKSYMDDFKDGLISFVQHNVANDINCNTEKDKQDKVKSIININYPYTQNK